MGMSLTSLRGAASLASTALDTARSTWKAMAEATVAPEEPAATPEPAPEPPGAGVPAVRKGARQGVALDAYA